MAKQKRRVGTFERIRQISPYAFGFFAVMLVAFFTIGDQTVVDGLTGRKTAQNIAIGTVNGEEISYKDYEDMVKERIEQQKAMQKDPDQPIDEKQIRDDVWNELVDQLLLRQLADDNGIVITDEMVARQILDNPPDYLRRAFSDSAGRFNRQLYYDLVTNPDNLVNYMGEDPSQISPEERREAVEQFRQDLIMVENYLRKQLLSNNVTNMVNSAGRIISPTFARMQYIATNSKATGDMVFLPVNKVTDDEINVTDQEVKKYYDENKQNFKQKPQRQIKYISIPIEPSGDDSARAVKRIQRIYDDLKDKDVNVRDSVFDIKVSEYGGQSFDFTLIKDLDRNMSLYLMDMEPREVLGPITLRDGTYFFRLDARRDGDAPAVKASHILIRFGNDKDSALAVTKDVLRKAKAGEDFATLASEYSQDPGSAARGGDLGWFSEGEMVQPFNDAAFAAKPGEITGPVETQFGYHIIKVENRQSTEIKYSQIKIAPTMSTITRNKLFRDAFSFKKQIEEGENFEGLAEKLGYRHMATPFFEKKRPVLGSRYLTDLIFNNELGTVLDPQEVEHYGLVVVKVAGERKAGIAPMEDVASSIRQQLGVAKKLDVLEPQAKELYNKLTGADSLGAASNFNPLAQVKSGVEIKGDGSVAGMGADAALAAAALKAPIGQLTGPIRGERGYYIIRVADQSKPSDDQIAQELPHFYQTLLGSQRGGVFYQWFSNAKEEADIEDFRYQYFKEY
ncbi:MAG: peptidylprolyl isomerase [Candidatus Kapaibacterium sp.]